MISSDKFFITHTTNISKLKSILKSRSLQPLELRKKLSKDEIEYEEISDFYSESKNKEKYVKSVFYGFLFPDENNIIEYNPKIDVHLIFSPKIIKDNANMYGCRDVKDLPVFCKEWKYGTIDENCYYYDCKKSLEENLNIWRSIALTNTELNIWTSTTNNEILMEGEMPLDADLIAIYVPEPTMLTKERLEHYNNFVTELKEKYPEYNWVEDHETLVKLMKIKGLDEINKITNDDPGEIQCPIT
jgi:hypothetical protein